MTLSHDGIIKEVEEKLKKESDPEKKEKIGEVYKGFKSIFSSKEEKDVLDSLLFYINPKKKEFDI